MLKACSCLLGFILLFGTPVFSQPGFVIKGKIQADFPQLIQIEYLDKIDSLLSEDGQFLFSGTLHHPALFRLSSRDTFTKRIATKEFFVEQGDIEISSTFKLLNSSKPAMQFAASQRILDEYNYKFSLLVDMYRFTRDSFISKSSTDTLLKKKVNKLSGKINRFEELYEKDFILQNSNNNVGAYFFYRYGVNFMSESETDSVYALFSDDVKSGFYLKKIAEKQMYAKLLKEGIAVPPLRLHNTKQKEVLLSSLFTKKLTLIDLWASWCLPCIETHALLKTLHTKFNKAGLDIIGISLDSKPESWSTYLKKHPLPWANFIDAKGEAGETNNIFNLVSGNGIPFFVLVNEKGEYLKIGIEAEELEAYITGYLKP